MTENIDTAQAESLEAPSTEPSPSSVVEPRAPFGSVEPWDYRKAASHSEARIGEFIGFHQVFARGLARALSVYLRTSVEVELSSGSQIDYDEFEAALPKDAFLALMRLESQPSPVILEMDSAIVSPILDLLLGGCADKLVPRSELSDVDVQIMSDMSRIVTAELQIAWHEAGLRFRSEINVAKASRRQLPPMSPMLVLTLKIKLVGSTGTMNILVPAPIIDAVLYTIEANPPDDGPSTGRTIGKECGATLAQVAIDMELILPSMQVAIRDLTRLSPNSVLRLPLRADQPAKLVIAGVEAFEAQPVRSGSTRAAQLKRPIPEKDRTQEKADSL